jgi:hypothetical protein
MKLGLKNISLLVLAAMLIASGCKTKEAPKPVATTELRLPTFGNPNKAEFYVIQPNPQSGNGQFVQRVNSGELLYAVPTPALSAADFMNMRVIVSGGDTSMRAIEVSLTATGKGKIQSLVGKGSAQTILIWKNLVWYSYPNSQLITTQSLIVADRLLPGFATDLYAALK